MGLPSTIFVTLLLLKSSLCFVDDVEDLQDVLGSPEDLDLEPYMDRALRSDAKYLRFGRTPSWTYERDPEPSYDPKQSSSPSRIGRQAKNDLFIRFGRSKRDFLR